MTTINEIADGFMEDSALDYVGLWEIVSIVRRDLGVIDNAQAKMRTLDVVRILLNRGLWPGDYLKSGFYFWEEPNAAAAVARIDKEWNPARGDPNMGDSICWFSTKRQ